MPDGNQSGGGRFPVPFTRNEVEAFLAFTKKTGEPEKYEALSHTPPDLALDHKLICDFSVARQKRPHDDCIPCALCREAPKFLHGHLLWSSDGNIRLVGNCCGPKYFGAETYREMKREAQEEKLEATRQDFLIANLVRVPAMIAGAKAMREVAARYFTHKRDFLRKVPSLALVLRNALRHNGGNLVVTRERSEVSTVVGPQGFRGGNAASAFDTIHVASIRGGAFLKEGFNPVKVLDSLLAKLQTLRIKDGAVITEEDSLAAVCEMDRRQLAEAYAKFTEADQGGRALHVGLGALSEFFSDQNLRDLKEWAGHPDNPSGYSVGIRQGSVLFRERDGTFVSLETGAVLSVPGLEGFGSDVASHEL